MGYMGGPVGGGDYHFCWIHVRDYQNASVCYRGEYVLKGKQVLPQCVQDLGFKFNRSNITSCLTDLVK